MADNVTPFPGAPDKSGRQAAPPTRSAAGDLDDQLAGLDDPVEQMAEQRRALRTLAPGDPFLGTEPGQWRGRADRLGLPPGCPVTPLGRDKDAFWFIGADGTVSALTPTASGKRHLLALFAPAAGYLKWAWPKFSKGGKPSDNFEADRAAEDLFNAATLKGGWDHIDQVRGRGSWLSESGQLIVHLGSRLLVNGEVRPCGELGSHVYPVRPNILPPVASGQAPEGPYGTGEQILSVLRTWNWARKDGDLDARLMLGWIAQALVGGALSWRSMMFLTGGHGTGKSTLHRMLDHLMAGSLVKAASTSAAGIYQSVRQDSLAVLVDEAENSARKMGRMQDLIELARIAASGGLILRGGADHQAVSFTARSAFLFSAINSPPMEPQDRSRMAILELRPLVNVRADAVLDVDELRRLGRQLLRRVIDWWPRLHASPDDPGLLARFRARLIESGHNSRGADQFGTLAAFSWLACNDDMPEPAALEEWAFLLAPDQLEETAEMDANWRDCLDHALTVQPDALRTDTWRTAGDLLLAWKAEAIDRRYLAQRLARLGIGLRFVHHVQAWSALELFFPNAHAGLQAVFERTNWAGAGGAHGPWAAALAQGPDDLVSRGKGRVGTKDCRGTFVRVGALLGDIDVRDYRKEDDT